MSEEDGKTNSQVEQRSVGYHWSVRRLRKVKRDKDAKFVDDELELFASGNTETTDEAITQSGDALQDINERMTKWEATK